MAVRNISDMQQAKLVKDDLSRFFDSLVITVESFGHWRQTDTNEILNYTVSDHELIFCEKGSSVFTKNNREIITKPGQILFLEPFNLYSAKCIGGEEVSYYYIHFRIEPYYLHAELAKVINASQLVFDIDPKGDVFKSVTSTWDRRETMPDGYAYTVRMVLAKALLRMACYHYKDNYRYVRPKYTRQALDIISGSINTLEETLDKPIQVGEIAKAVGVSESKLYKCFNEMLGVSPSRYFMQYKITKADQMLMTSDLTIEQISEKLGFSSAFHLSKVYKELKGAAPSNTRKLYKQKKKNKQ